ncbi:GNAT family N-acetyltransferase [Paenibacillus sp. KQZ6P-2]|uniref:GNAT family N-acetyltransferase n=1 Tax=Paenibacillus mangrovi TaxID=2931978 RepID=A0A9X1WRC3_9BACL|nr:GNAT family N-acetyltransferase [Paenibacillus mangrovi]MCJ8013659.1 GNAT family N-acetyltransferase [Paenibacillus mangrovi]
MHLINSHTEDTCLFHLSDEYSIQRAEPEVWGIFCSIYYNMRYNGFFREEKYNTPKKNSFWIQKGDRKIGGVRMEPNKIYHLFFIPPFNDTFEVLKLLKKMLIHWSDPTKPIKTFEILPDQVDLYARAGFWPDEFRCRWMHRPTDHFEVHWDENFRVDYPQIEENESGIKRFTKEDEIARCDFDSFSGSIEAARRKKHSIDDFIPSEDPYYTNELLVKASTLVYDKHTGQLVANCRLCLQDNQAAVYSIGVIPSYRGRGLATLMLKRALSILKEDYPILRLYVMEGNAAESVYVNLGFVAGVQEIQSMYIPVHE